MGVLGIAYCRKGVDVYVNGVNMGAIDAILEMLYGPLGWRRNMTVFFAFPLILSYEDDIESSMSSSKKSKQLSYGELKVP